MPPGGLRLVQLYNTLDPTNDEVATGASAAQTGGLSRQSWLSAATINDTVVKSSAGRLYHIRAANSNAAVRYVKFYDKATAPDPSAGDLPVWRMVVGGGSALVPPDSFPHGLAFANGIGFVIVTGIGDTDETAPGATEVTLNLAWK